MHSINKKYVSLVQLKHKCFESQLINLTPFTQNKRAYKCLERKVYADFVN